MKKPEKSLAASISILFLRMVLPSSRSTSFVPIFMLPQRNKWKWTLRVTCGDGMKIKLPILRS
uniref:Uncharacterized protein n=1 Tax=Rhizophora mucronata TaxID=61149 RepID=A0A2P2NUI9_RHIMU